MPSFSFPEVDKTNIAGTCFRYCPCYTLCMTPIDRSTRHARMEDPFPKQHYLSRHGGQWVWGYFPWNGSVIVVGFDGSRPDSLQHIKENSVCELLTVDAARRHWNERLEWEYSAVDPKDWAALTYRITVHGIALNFVNKRQANTAFGMMQDFFNTNSTPAIQEIQEKLDTLISTHYENYEHKNEYTNYALEA